MVHSALSSQWTGEVDDVGGIVGVVAGVDVRRIWGVVLAESVPACTKDRRQFNSEHDNSCRR